MKEQELLYYFPYRIDKQQNFRTYANDITHNSFVKRFVPNYDGTNVQEFITNKSILTIEQVHDFEYLYGNFRHWKEWFQNGQNIFSFSKELLQLLDKTDVYDVKPELFKPPYDIFYLNLKPLNLKLSKSSEAIIEGVYIDHNIWNGNGEHPEGYCDLSFYFVGDFKEIFLKYISTVKSSTQPFTNDDYVDEMPIGDFWNIYLWFEKSEKRETVKEALDYYLKNLKDEIFVTNKTPEQVTDFDLDFYSDTIDLIERTINLVINCMLYLSQPKDKLDIEKKLPIGLPGNFEKKLSFAKTEKEKKKISEKIEQAGFSKINFVGQSFRNRYNEIINGNLTVQPHWRRGHWRNQKFGAKLKESKLIWIMPTIVKNEIGKPLKGHLYDVDNKATNR